MIGHQYMSLGDIDCYLQEVVQKDIFITRGGTERYIYNNRCGSIDKSRGEKMYLYSVARELSYLSWEGC